MPCNFSILSDHIQLSAISESEKMYVSVIVVWFSIVVCMECASRVAIVNAFSSSFGMVALMLSGGSFDFPVIRFEMLFDTR